MDDLQMLAEDRRDYLLWLAGYLRRTPDESIREAAAEVLEWVAEGEHVPQPPLA